MNTSDIMKSARRLEAGNGGRERTLSELIISVSGLRGIVGDTLTSEIVARYANAFAAEAPAGPLLVTRDGRNSGELFSQVVSRALHDVGRDVLDGGIAATPTTGVLIRELHCAGGIQISASHNPAQYNGLKLFSAMGRVISAEEGESVLARFRASSEQVESGLGPANATVINDQDSHLDRVAKTIDIQGIRQHRFRVLLDSNHGAGSRLGKQLLDRLGCEIILLGGEPDGQFEHLPEPTAENLRDTCHRVARSDVNVGFCQDPDADRLAVIDQRGNYVGEECTLALCVEHVLRHTPGPIVTNCSTSRMSEDLAEKHGVRFHRSAVGEANVVDKMVSEEAVFGGEGNGGPIDPEVGYVRDSFVGMARILDAMAGRQMTVSELVGELPKYAIRKTKVELDRSRFADTFDRLQEHFPEAQADRLDGLRLDWPDQWALIRASNTEPIVRIVVEAKTQQAAHGLCDTFRKQVEG